MRPERSLLVGLDIYRITTTSTPIFSATDAHCLSAVQAGNPSRMASARQKRSPSDNPALEVTARRCPATLASSASASTRVTGNGCNIARSEEHTSELQSLMRISYAVFCLKKKNTKTHRHK